MRTASGHSSDLSTERSVSLLPIRSAQSLALSTSSDYDALLAQTLEAELDLTVMGDRGITLPNTAIREKTEAKALKPPPPPAGPRAPPSASRPRGVGR